MNKAFYFLFFLKMLEPFLCDLPKLNCCSSIIKGNRYRLHKNTKRHNNQLSTWLAREKAKRRFFNLVYVNSKECQSELKILKKKKNTHKLKLISVVQNKNYVHCLFFTSVRCSKASNVNVDFQGWKTFPTWKTSTSF